MRGLSQSAWFYIGALFATLAIFGAIGAYISSSPNSTSADELQPSASEMKLQRLWNFVSGHTEQCKPSEKLCGNSYFRCDYTSLTCQSGYQLSAGVGAFYLYVLLADDRKTAIAHLFCYEGASEENCMSFDTGEVRYQYNSSLTASEDIPERCFRDAAPDTGDFCEAWLERNLGGLMAAYLISNFQLPHRF